MLYTIFALILITAAVIQLCYTFFFLWMKWPVEERPVAALPAVSVVICARNEAENLARFLPLVLRQEYSGEWEVVLVNDGSADHSASVLEALALQYSRLKVVTIAPVVVKDLPGKKYALREGIAAAAHDRLLLTDADCAPASALWLQQMVGSGKAVVLGYGGYEERPGLLNKFIRWETVHTCMQYSAYALAGLPYMGVGRNLSYRKQLLPQAAADEAFQEKYRHTPSGDDDLLVARIATPGELHVCLARSAHTLSVPPPDGPAWWRQKTRHMSTGKYYPRKVQSLLGLYALSHSLYWFLGLPLAIVACIAGTGSPGAFWRLSGCLASPDPLVVALLGLLLLRLAAYWMLAARWYRKLGEKKLFLFYPLGDLGWALYNVFLSPYILWKNRKAWK